MPTETRIRLRPKETFLTRAYGTAWEINPLSTVIVSLLLMVWPADMRLRFAVWLPSGNLQAAAGLSAGACIWPPTAQPATAPAHPAWDRCGTSYPAAAGGKLGEPSRV